MILEFFIIINILLVLMFGYGFINKNGFLVCVTFLIMLFLGLYIGGTGIDLLSKNFDITDVNASFTHIESSYKLTTYLPQENFFVYFIWLVYSTTGLVGAIYYFYLTFSNQMKSLENLRAPRK